jgi:serine/threonine-protein kinase
MADALGPPILVARFDRRSELAPIVRAALDVDIVYVPLEAAPAHGKHTLQLWVGDQHVTSVTAELVGSGRAGEYPLRVRPSGDAHVADLEALAERRTSSTNMIVAAPTGPRPRRSQELPAVAPFPHDPDTEPRGGQVLTEAGAEDSTLASRGVPRAPMPSTVGEEEQVAPTSLFDPESLLRAPAPPNTGSDDSLTLPRSPNSPPSRRPRPDPSTPVHEESGTLPRDLNRKADDAVSWNIRITPTTKDPLCGRVIANKYVLDSVIGTGAIGIVFKASHRDLGRTVAIKVLNPRYRDDTDLLQTFQTEARAASQLEHPNVARVYDYGTEDGDGLVYIVMEYLSGYTLGSVLSARRKLVEGRAVDIMMQVCAALSAAHERGIVHRDVKPDNIVLVPAQDDEGQPVEVVKVCDFGIAALGPRATSEGYAAGSPEYMAPEQTTGSDVAPATDVYACGIVLYEMLTGEVPFTDSQPYRIFIKHQSEAPRKPSILAPDISRPLEAAILRALEKQPLRRFHNARELRLELRRIAESKS